MADRDQLRRKSTIKPNATMSFPSSVQRPPILIIDSLFLIKLQLWFTKNNTFFVDIYKAKSDELEKTLAQIKDDPEKESQLKSKAEELKKEMDKAKEANEQLKQLKL